MKPHINNDIRDQKEDLMHEQLVNSVTNKKVKNSWDAQSKTFNGKAPKNNEEITERDRWDTNNNIITATGRDYEEPYDVYTKDDYIDSDHSEYNRSNSRFRWEEPEEEE
ncbi:hypothetical protein GR160_01390 [Flavobacterium sp. Sd200]|uniref:hypothetical protein n=1 Tax=Flavobacterium sp. Sd200 TaxID=2692211 RepID=UPI00136E1698|nr:hypothetical protein [Flavobacterium sp. Sd200]MXN89867.1 hypothetical protein [Flavobacterium sp. Sd200]